MKINEAKVYLSRIKVCDMHINDRLNEIERLKAIVMKITSALKDDAGGGRSGNQNKIGSCVSRLIDLEAELNAEIDAYINKRNEICEMLDGLENARQFDVLYKRYVLYEKWSRIAEEMGFTDVRGVYKLHGIALKNLNFLLKKHKKSGLGH